MIKKTLTTVAMVALLSTSALATNINSHNGGNTTTNTNPVANGGDGGSAIQGQLQGQSQSGVNTLDNNNINKNKANAESNANALAGAAALSGSASKSGVKNSGNSESKSGVYGSGNSANLNAQIDASKTTNKQKTDASSKNDVSTNVEVKGDVYNEAKNNANTAIAPVALSNWGCSMGGSAAVQGDQFGFSAGGAKESTDCVANRNAAVVATLFPEDKDLQKAELCTGKQHREAFEARGIDAKYCKSKSTWLGLKPIATGVKELVLSPFRLVGWIFGA